MDEKAIKFLESLIEEGEKWNRKIITKTDGLGFAYYKPENSGDYEIWKNKTYKFIKTFAPDDYVELPYSQFSFQRDHEKQIGMLKAIREMSLLGIAPKGSTEILKEEPDISKFHLNIYNSQSQSQSVTVSIFLESLKSELSEEQYAELKKIHENFKEKPEEAKTKILDKIKSFGENVASSILANLITNPSIWNNFL